MSLRRQLLTSFGVQGVGAAAVLLATLSLGASFGAEVQGTFSRTKSEIEFIAALAMFGLPQALFFYVKSGALSGRAALRWVRGSTLLALPIGAVYALAQHGRASLWPVLLLSLAVAACVAHGQLRALLLVRERTVWFNGVTALPQLLVLVGVAALIGWGTAVASAWVALFGLAHAAAGLLAWRRLRAAGYGLLVAVPVSPAAPAMPVAPAVPAAPLPPAVAIGWRGLGHYGLAAWLTAVLATAAILAAQRWVEAAEGAAALGQFTLAITLVQVPLTPISYAAPLLFRRWMEHPGEQVSRRWAGVLCALVSCVALATWGLASVWPDLGLGPNYAGVTRALALLLAGGAAEAASRVLTVQASASGLPWVGVRAELARWGVLGLGALLPLPPGLLPLCAVWALAAGAAAAVFVQHAHGRAGSAAAGAAR